MQKNVYLFIFLYHFEQNLVLLKMSEGIFLRVPRRVSPRVPLRVSPRVPLSAKISPFIFTKLFINFYKIFLYFVYNIVYNIFLKFVGLTLRDPLYFYQIFYKFF